MGYHFALCFLIFFTFYLTWAEGSSRLF